MKKLTLFFISALFLVFSLNAAVLRVPTQYPTIQAAVSAASAGDTVSVALGTYSEHVVVNQGLYILGDDMYTTVIDAGGSDRCITVPNIPGSVGQISGFTFTNTGRGISGSYACAGVCVNTMGSGNWEISWNIFKDNPDLGILNFDGGVIKRNIFENNGYNGNYRRAVMASSYSSLTIINNSFRLNNQAIYKHSAGVSVDIRNNIIVDNQTGIYISGTGATIDYNDVYNNGVNYSGCVSGPHDISADPLFVGGTPYDYNLTTGSPCIDAGDPNSPLDPDGTRADMGALYFDQSRLMMSFTPHNPPIRIPAGGGSFTFDALVVNNSSNPLRFDAWTMVILPNGVSYGPVFRRDRIPIAVGGTIMRALNQSVPGFAPYGNYTYVGNVGVFPDSIVDTDSFPFEKLAGDGAPNHNQGWSVYGWEDSFEPLSPGIPTEAVLLSALPNPFNPSTVICFQLRGASLVKLAVYDITGREAALLAEGYLPEGKHQAVFDASSLPSGVYFARINCGGEIFTEKLLLIK